MAPHAPTKHSRLRKILLLALAVCIALLTAVFGGPAASGALLLLLPSGQTQIDHDLPATYAALHKGYVDLATGLYIREDEDLVVGGTPALILRRTYLSGDHFSRQFGVGTTHSGERYLIGDGARFQWAELILATGTRVRFRRTSPGTSFLNAMFAHQSSPSEWMDAQMGWTGGGWALRRADGELLRFQACSPGSAGICSLLSERDPDGHTIRYTRNSSGRLTSMAAADRWIAFEYDNRSRIIRASDSGGREVGYEYDNRGRLTTVKASDGETRRYAYTGRDEMATITDPGTTIENKYDENGRCIRQANHYPNGAEPYIFEFTYRTEGDRIVQAETKESDGSLARYTFNTGGYTTGEMRSYNGVEVATLDYERDVTTNTVTALTMTCPDRNGKPLRHSSLVRPGEEESVKQALATTHCFWDKRRRGHE